MFNCRWLFVYLRVQSPTISKKLQNVHILSRLVKDCEACGTNTSQIWRYFTIEMQFTRVAQRSKTVFKKKRPGKHRRNCFYHHQHHHHHHHHHYHPNYRDGLAKSHVQRRNNHRKKKKHVCNMSYYGFWHESFDILSLCCQVPPETL